MLKLMKIFFPKTLNVKNLMCQTSLSRYLILNFNKIYYSNMLEKKEGKQINFDSE